MSTENSASDNTSVKQKIQITQDPIKTKFSVWLLKGDIPEEQLFGGETLSSVDIPNVGTVYKSQIPLGVPGWVDTFFNGQIDGLTKGGAGAILKTSVEVDGAVRHFLVSFGYGFHKINKFVCEGRFGLKIVLNAGDLKSGVRSVDKRNLSSAPRLSREQSSKHEGISTFGIDYEQDMINALTLASQDSELGTTITGGTALSISTHNTLDDIRSLLPKLYEYYSSDKYKQQGYEWIDHINDAPKKYIPILDAKLVAAVNEYSDDNETCYFSPPELEDYTDVIGFGPSSKKYDKVKDGIVLDDYRTGKDGIVVFEEIEDLKKRQVHVWSSTADHAVRHWNLYRCINIELAHDGHIFVLSNGKWYMVNSDFSNTVDQWYQQLEIVEGQFQLYEKVSYTEKGVTKLKHSEKNFNEKASEDGTYACLDRDLIDIGPRKDIEACDLYQPQRFMHVKIYTGSSAPISHLLAQATVSAELFCGDESFRGALNAKLPDGMKLSDAEVANPTRTNYKISLGVITNKSTLELPFFSRINLRSALQRLSLMGLQTEVVRIAGNF